MSRPAAFLDRDGTIIRDVKYIARPEQAQLLPGAADAIRKLNDHGWPVVVVTNQSGIARGLYTREAYDAVQRRVVELLAQAGARIDATFVCPHHPDFTGPCDCRKPGTLLFRQAAEQLDLDLHASLYIGDRLRDVEPAEEFGGHGILVPTAEATPQDIAEARRRFSVAPSLDEAIGRFIESGE